ncbi:MAG TPA: GNAT family N-acetyltransferase [Enhygromyxa sp.]|nr:GNAT family N-acetyltransferase [Enhygromyxa sp.]
MSAPELHARVLEGHAGLIELRDEWRTLCEQCPWATPFQRPEWLLAWAGQLRPERPWTIAVRERGRLIGLAPLFLYRRGNARVLALLGAGASDYGDVLALPGRERAVVRAMLSALARRRARWDVCELDEVRPAISPLTRLTLPRGWSMRVSTQSTCPSLALPARVDELSRHVPPRHLRRFEQYRRRAASAGTLALERATPDTCERLLDTLFDLHEARWRAHGKPGGFADSRVRALHREAAVALAKQDALALYVLRIDQRPIACLYGYEHDRTLYFYLGGFDPAAASLSPGALVLGLVLETSIQRGLTRFDFLRGSEAYKYWWGAEDRHTVRLRLTLDRDHARAVHESELSASNRP